MQSVYLRDYGGNLIEISSYNEIYRNLNIVVDKVGKALYNVHVIIVITS